MHSEKETPPPTLFDRLVADSESAFGASYFRSAYHSLAAAMHCAEQDRDVTRLQAVARVAVTQQTDIETIVPGTVRRNVAGMGGQFGFYQTLQRQIAATIRLVEIRETLASRPVLTLIRA